MDRSALIRELSTISAIPVTPISEVPPDERAEVAVVFATLGIREMATA